MQQFTQYIPYVATAASLFAAYKVFKWSHNHHSVLDTFKKGQLENYKIRTDFFPNYFQNKQGLTIHTRRYLVPNPKGLIFWSHGYTEHSGRYEGTILQLNKLGYSVCAIDHQGHGNSQGDRNFIHQFEDYVDDVIQWMNLEWDNMLASRFQWSLPFFQILNDNSEQAKNPITASPTATTTSSYLSRNVFVLGHSMGGLIAVRVALELKKNPARLPFINFQTHPIRFLLSAPALALDKELTDIPLLISISKFLSNLIPKAIVQSMPDKPISTISEVHEMTIRDPTVNEQLVSARFGAEFIKSIEFCIEHVKDFDFPVFLMQSYEDNIVDGYGVKKWFDKISTKSEDAVFCVSKGYHEVLFDLERDRLLEEMSTWIIKHTNQ